MAQAVAKIGGNDIFTKFIITKKYGDKGGWPYGTGSTIVLSTVEIYYTKHSPTSIKDCKLTIMAVYKNGGYQEHAEGFFLEDLREEINTLLEDEATKVNKIQAKLVQNYSPCNNYSDDHKSGCADDILEFIEDMEQKDIIFSLTIKFGTFYYHQKTPNKEGLKKLLRNGVKLELLQGTADWEAFLNDENFVQLIKDEYRDEYEELLERATSRDRMDREEEDEKILTEIKFEAEPEGRQEAIKQYSHIVNRKFLGISH
jgi:hypothetical protein